MKTNKVIFLILTMLLAACGKPGADYLGKCQATGGKHSVEISRNGGNLLLKIKEPAYKGLFLSDPGNTATSTLSGTVKDGLLKIDGTIRRLDSDLRQG